MDHVKLLILYLISILPLAITSPQRSSFNLNDEYADLESVELDPEIVDLLLSNGKESNDFNTDPYSYAESGERIGADLSISKPAFGISGGGAGVSLTKPGFEISGNKVFSLVKPQVEVLRLIESFIRLKAELITKFQVLINENYDLIKSVFNVVISKIGHLHQFSLQGISVIRKIIEFALNLFSGWGVGVGASIEHQPHEIYGAFNY